MQVTLIDGRSFPAPAGTSILDAAAAHGLTLEHGCRTARCGGCKARVRAGHSEVLQHELSLTDAERADGIILTCARGAAEGQALELDIDAVDVPAIAPRVVPARIDAVAPLSDDVVAVTLRLPPNAAFRFHPGQYVDVIGPGGVKRSYSMADAGAAHGRIALQIRKVDGGALSAYWFGAAQAGDLLRIRGPLGSFVLRDVAGRDLVFLATGTGIAPVLALLAQVDALDAAARPASVRVYWGGRTEADHYLPAARFDGVDFRPVLSRAGAAWTGRRGHVQSALLADVLADGGTDWSWASVYACGSEAMVRDARAALAAAGLPPRQFFADAFVASTEARPSR